MNLATFWVEGNGTALASVVRTLAIEVDRQWRAGDRNRSGKVRDTDGFSCTIADANSHRELAEAIDRFSGQCAQAGLSFRSLELSATLSVGVSVGEDQQFIASLEFPADLLATLGQLGVSLEVNAYPTSDGANAT
jgi:hypothetical protein